MNCVKENLLLYAVTDRTWLPEPGIEALAGQVEQALRGGVTMLQLREKELPQEEFLREAYVIKALCDRHGVPLIINDNVEIALAVDAAGVHLGLSDTGITKARALLGQKKIIGASARTVERAVLAEEKGADYLGVGAVFSTGTKRDAKTIDRETLVMICQAVSIPVAAIGGITADNVAQLAGSGVDGIAVVSAIFAQADIGASARSLREAVENILGTP